MVRLILQTEWRLLRRDPAVAVLALLYAALTLFAVVRGQQWHQEQVAAVARVVQADQKQNADYRADFARIAKDGKPAEEWADPRVARWVARGGQRLHLPPLPSAPLAIGQADLLPLEAHIVNHLTAVSLWDRVEIDNPLLTRYGRFDLAFVLVALLPLLLLAVSYNLLSADREQGTLALALAQSVSPTRLAWLRLLARGGLVLAFALGLTLAALALAGVPMLEADTLLRLGFWAALVVAYGFLWLALALWVNTLRTSSAVNALVLAGAWTVIVLLFPALLNLLVVSLHPPPSRVALATAMRTAGREARAEGAKALAEFYHDHPELRPKEAGTNQVNFTTKHYATRQRAERDVQPLLEEFDRQLARQRSLVAWAQYLSPSVLVSEAFGDLAGTGTARHQAFRESIAQGLHAWHAWFIPRIVKNEPLTEADHAAIPRLTLRPDAARDLAPRVGGALCGLAAPTLLFAALASARLRRNRLSIHS